MYVAFPLLVSGSHNGLCSIAAQQVRTKFNDAPSGQEKQLSKFRLVWPLILPRLWHSSPSQHHTCDHASKARLMVDSLKVEVRPVTISDKC